jgi:hypothetical protein
LPRLGDDPLSRRRKAPRVAGPQDAFFVPSVPLETLQYPQTPVEIPIAGPAESSGSQTVAITVMPSQPAESFAEAPSAPAVLVESAAPSPAPSPREEQPAPQEKSGFFGRIFGKLRR